MLGLKGLQDHQRLFSQTFQEQKIFGGHDFESFGVIDGDERQHEDFDKDQK